MLLDISLTPLFILLFPNPIYALSSYPPTRNLSLSYDQVCPNISVYSPFTRWPSLFLQYPDPTVTANTACWWWADCVLTKADEVRKQQFAATSFVMGLVPLALKDIAWPERRRATVVKGIAPLNWTGEVVVRGLGLTPVAAVAAQEKWKVGQGLGKGTQTQPRRRREGWRGVITLGLLGTGLLAAYGTLVVMEYVSRGAQVLTLRLRESSKKRRSVATKELPRIQQSLLLEEAASSADSVPEVKLDMNVSRYLEEEQGTEVEWWVQFIWAVYYAAGTLVFASIMAVTVIELFVWVVLACFTTAMSKMLAFRLCGHWE
ncbi:hypothetical protein MMC14_008080 [Varicellaria rhodocarpa]|nr:hypothetical protein [Varicellaria rhodocarpa]